MMNSEQMFKNFTISNKRLVAWCIYYLSHSGKNKFFTEDIQKLMVYDTKAILQELHNQLKWVREVDTADKGSFVNILAWHGNEFTIKEKPYSHRGDKFLVTDLNSRVNTALLNLPSKKSVYSIIDVEITLQQLERSFIENALTKLNVIHNGAEWFIGEAAHESIKLEILSSNYPEYGITYLKGNPFFKVVSRKLYVDMPNYTFGEFIGEIQKIVTEYPKEPSVVYELAKKAEVELNKWFASYFRKLINGKPESAHGLES